MNTMKENVAYEKGTLNINVTSGTYPSSNIWTYSLTRKKYPHSEAYKNAQGTQVGKKGFYLYFQRSCSGVHSTNAKITLKLRVTGLYHHFVMTAENYKNQNMQRLDA